MNLTNNFIQPDEIRSASLISIKALAKIAALVIPVILALFLVRAYLIYVEQRSTLNLLESTWSSTEVKKKHVTDLSATLKSTTRSLGEVQGWERSRVTWHEVLTSIQQQVPPVIQIKALQARQSLHTGRGGQIERQMRISLTGRCRGPDADAKVEVFRKQLGEAPALASLVKVVVIADFREDSEPGADSQDRAFQIDVVITPRSFSEVTAKQ